jgi:hypothetical protein
VLPVLWAILPLLAGPALADALGPRSALLRTACSLALWLIWAATLIATMIPRTVTLTVVRIVVPASVVATGWAALVHPGAAGVVAVSAAAVTTVVALGTPTATRFVNGSAYGLELRRPLRAPASLLLGPVELAWLATVAGAVAGPLVALAVDSPLGWLLGAVLTALGWTVAWWTARSLHVLSRRWLVFTPAGLVLHDQLAVVEALLVLSRQIRAVGPALVGTSARDLTVGAPGLALELSLAEPLTIAPTPRRHLRSRDAVVNEDVSAVLFTPSRPGQVLAECAARGLPTSGPATTPPPTTRSPS